MPGALASHRRDSSLVRILSLVLGNLASSSRPCMTGGIDAVPALRVGSRIVAESLAVAEYLAEATSGNWPLLKAIA